MLATASYQQVKGGIKMNAVKFLKEKNRMCNCHNDYCCDCPLEDYDCDGTKEEEFEAIVAAVEKWSDEHPLKTILIDLLEKYPKTLLDEDGTPNFCPHQLGYEKDKAVCSCKSCTSCWNRPIEE